MAGLAMHAVSRPPERLVHRLRLRWPTGLPRPAELTWRSRAEDALRTASTAERSRVVFVRRLALALPAAAAGAAPTAARALHAPMERALQAAVAQAVPAQGADRRHAEAVWFVDWDAAVAHLLTRWLDGPAPVARTDAAPGEAVDAGGDWVEAAIVRGLPARLPVDPAAVAPARPVAARVAAAWAAWLQTPTSGLAAAIWAVGRWRADPTRQRPWLQAAARALGLPPAEAGANSSARQGGLTTPVERVLSALHCMLVHGQPDWRIAIAAEAQRAIGRSGSVASPASGQPLAPRASRRRLRFDAIDGATATGASPADARGTSWTAVAAASREGGSPAAEAAGPTRPSAEGGDWPNATAAGEPNPAMATPPGAAQAGWALSQPPWAGGELVVTQLGGLVLLLGLLQRLGFGDWLDAQPEARQRTLAMAPFRAALAAAVRRRVNEPAWEEVLAAPPGDAVSAAAGRAWLRRAGRAARAWGCGPLRGLLWRRAGLVVTRTHLDLVFRLDQVDPAVRRAALDADPGWVPWFGRIVSLHFEPGDPWTEAAP